MISCTAVEEEIKALQLGEGRAARLPFLWLNLLFSNQLVPTVCPCMCMACSIKV